MTCVACSSSVERLMHNEFDGKGMVSVTIVLLTHKMFAQFEASRFESKEVTPELIVDEVEMIGFDCELTGITEISQEDMEPEHRPSRDMKNGEISSSFNSEFSIDRNKLVGQEDDEEVLT